ncbi:hypothetical protein CSA08_05030 [Candidatus Gracilibacteria bacterium]|nr:MAG: hypothetical protein CSA08_05030 [Candidatus Gracilibacteria bacterium]
MEKLKNAVIIIVTIITVMYAIHKFFVLLGMLWNNLFGKEEKVTSIKQDINKYKKVSEINIKTSNKYIKSIIKLVNEMPSVKLYKGLSNQEIKELKTNVPKEYKDFLKFTKGVCLSDFRENDINFTDQEPDIREEYYGVENGICLFDPGNGDAYVLFFDKNYKETIYFLTHEDGKATPKKYKFEGFIEEMIKYILEEESDIGEY